MKIQDKEQNLLLANRIKTVRVERAMSRSQVSEASGISEAVIINIETGTTTISLDHLIALCRGMGCSMDYVVGIVAETVEDNSIRGRMLKTFDAFNLEQQNLVGVFVEFVKSLR